MNIVLPMAGHGSRFAEAGYLLPKPLIDVRGRPMYTWAMDSLPIKQGDQLIFICLAEHLEEFDLQNDIETRYREFSPHVIGIDGVTEGQACTVLLAEGIIDTDSPLLIYNADTYCKTNMEPMIRQTSRQGKTIDGVLGVFRAKGDKWSFAKTDASGQVSETAEKKRISDWACTGMYYFANGSEFVYHAKQMILNDDRTNGEFYVAPVYNRLITAGHAVWIDEAQEVWGLGTPEDLSHFLEQHPSDQDD